MPFACFKASSTRALMALCALSASLPAWSQSAGLYTGITSQGQPIWLEIAPSPTRGVNALTFVQVVYEVACEQTGRVSVDGYAVSADAKLNPQGGFAKQLFTARFHGAMRATFDGVDTFTGSTSLYGAKLLPSLPVVAEGCTATDVSFTAKLQPGLSRTPLPLGGLDSRLSGVLGADGRVQHERQELSR